ncbi:MAG TPA: hypothetical protein VHR86_08065 [Armatimonadota bacterium]|nr:hypothetical protein [Armatimonadota bacterium]
MMADQDRNEEPIPRIDTAEDVVRTAEEEVADTNDLLIPAGEEARRRRERRAAAVPAEEAPPEDEEVNPVGSYESWNQSGQGLDAAGSGMTGDSGSVGLTGTGFEDDTDV